MLPLFMQLDRHRPAIDQGIADPTFQCRVVHCLMNRVSELLKLDDLGRVGAGDPVELFNYAFVRQASDAFKTSSV